ncbi:MAG: LPS translocon maturation chaperone LptM [Burkholderiales bacterium]
MRSAFLTVLIALLFGLALAGCGNKGGLYLPESKPAPKSAPAAPAVVPAAPAPATPADPAK